MNHLRARWRQVATKTAAMKGPIYRGVVVELPDEMYETIDDLLVPPTEEEHRGRHYQIGPLLLGWLQANHWEAEFGYGLGRHWSERRAVSVRVQGPGVLILLTANYDPSGVDRSFTRTTPHLTESESEVTLLPGTRVMVTAVEMLNYYGAKGRNLLREPMEARA